MGTRATTGPSPEETRLANDARGFDIETGAPQSSAAYYETTIDHWLANMPKHAGELKAMVGDQHYRDFRVYLRLARHIAAQCDPAMWWSCRRFD